MSNNSMNIYAQNILDRYKEPYYRDKKIKPDISGGKINRSCGDDIKVELEIDGNVIKAYSFTGVGCAISQASADILGDLIIGMNLDEVKNMTKDELFETLGIEISERRSKCALLALEAIKQAILSK